MRKHYSTFDLHLIEPQTVDIEGITEQVIRNIKNRLAAM